MASDVDATVRMPRQERALDAIDQRDFERRAVDQLRRCIAARALQARYHARSTCTPSVSTALPMEGRNSPLRDDTAQLAALLEEQLQVNATQRSEIDRLEQRVREALQRQYGRCCRRSGLRPSGCSHRRESGYHLVLQRASS